MTGALTWHTNVPAHAARLHSRIHMFHAHITLDMRELNLNFHTGWFPSGKFDLEYVP